MKKLVKILPILILCMGMSAKAALALPRLTFNPATGTYNNGDTFTVKVGAQSEGKKVAGVDANITYDSAKLEVVGKPELISTVTNFNIYPKVEAGVIKVTLVKDSSGQAVEQTGDLAGDLFTITFKTKAVGTATNTFSCTQSSMTDSNILTNDTGAVIDIISCADNQTGVYTINAGTGGAPTSTPVPSSTTVNNTTNNYTTVITQTPAKTELPKTGNTAVTVGLMLLGGIGMLGAFILKAL